MKYQGKKMMREHTAYIRKCVLSGWFDWNTWSDPQTNENEGCCKTDLFREYVGDDKKLTAMLMEVLNSDNFLVYSERRGGKEEDAYIYSGFTASGRYLYVKVWDFDTRPTIRIHD